MEVKKKMKHFLDKLVKKLFFLLVLGLDIDWPYEHLQHKEALVWTYTQSLNSYCLYYLVNMCAEKLVSVL